MICSGYLLLFDDPQKVRVVAVWPSVRTKWQDWTRTGNVTFVTPWALPTHIWFYTDLQRSAVCRIPNRTKKESSAKKVTIVQLGFRVTLGITFNIPNFPLRDAKLFQHACQSDWDTVSMVSKNKKKRGCVTATPGSLLCFNAHSGKIRMYTQRRRPEVKSNKSPFARLEVEVGMFSSLR